MEKISDILKRYINRKNRNKLSIITIILSSIFLINYFFFVPTQINEYLVTNNYYAEIEYDCYNPDRNPDSELYDACVFDAELYKCMVDAYNDENSTNLSYNDRLTVSQLDTITHLSCTNKQISNATNLGYMHNLTYLDLSSNQLTSIDVSRNTEIIHLDVKYNKLTGINIGNNKKLTYLNVVENNLTNIDVSNNTELSNFYAGYNQLTSIDVSNNSKLIEFEISYNKLTSIDVSKNTLLQFIYVDSNQLTGIDLSKNDALVSYELSNPFRETLYVYKGEYFTIGNNVKLPSHLNDSPRWTVNDVTIADINNEATGEFKALKAGTVDIIVTKDGFPSTSTVNVVEITSDKYVILDDYYVIYIGNDTNIGNITENIKKSDENITIDYEAADLNDDSDNDTLIIYHDDVGYIKSFSIISSDFDKYIVIDNTIVVPEEVSYDEFINEIGGDAGISYKVFNGNEEVNDGNILDGMRLLVYYGDEKIYEYKISDKYFYFDEGLFVDEKNYMIYNIKNGTTIRNVLDKIYTSARISVFDKSNNLVKDYSGVLGTGYKYNIELSDEILEYIVSVKGDINGDGLVNDYDLSSISKHIITDEYLSGKEHIKASDVDDSNRTDINDVIKVAKHVINGAEL